VADNRPRPALAGVSGTGLTVAGIRAAETARPDRLFADPLAAAFVAAAGAPPPRATGRAAAALRWWIVARTVFLDELITAACADGVRQVVLLGAGFDTRAFRLSWPPGVRCFELDTGDVLAAKQQVLAEQGAVAACERIVVPADLGGDWVPAVRAAALDPGRPAVWVAEGLLVYLSPGQVDRLLDGLTSLSAPGSRLGLTFRNRERDDRGAPAPALRRSAAPDDPVGWLAGHGWAAELASGREVLRAHGRPVPAARPDGRGGPRPRALLISAALDPARRSGRPAASTAVRAQPPSPAVRGETPSPAASPAVQAPPPGAAAGPAIRPPAAGPDHPLPTLLSQTLVAFTIEFDNESEHQIQHRTTHGPASGSRGPWLASEVMWANFLRFVPAAGLPLGEVDALARVVNVAGLQRWGYLTLGPAPADRRARPPRRDWMVRVTAAGQRAQSVWRPLTAVIERRWRERFGAAELAALTSALQAVAGQITLDLPPYLPVTGVHPADHGAWFAAGRQAGREGDTELPALLSRVLLAFAVDVERESPVSMVVGAGLLRVLGTGPARVAGLPSRAGLSREAVSVALGWLQRRGYAVTGPDPAASRGQLARLTRRGHQAQREHQRLAGAVGQRWRDRFGADRVDELAGALRRLFADEDGQQRIAAGLVPYPGGWRAHPPYLSRTQAMVGDPAGTLPHYPMVSHRGGFPDGS